MFPLRGKVPRVRNGSLDATSVLPVVRGWWKQWPEANIAIVGGASSGLLIVDIDPRNGGDDTWGALTDVHGEPKTLTVTTGGEQPGKHMYFRWPEGLLLKKVLGPGIDLQGTNKYVVAPPSVHPDTGNIYQWDDPSVPVADAPGWLLDLAEKEPPKKSVRGPVDPNDDRPGSRFNANAEWADIMEGAGWTLVRAEGDCMYWCRPGKTEGISATTNHAGSDLLYVFSSSTEFEADTGYSKFAAYTVLEHDGDFAEAARALGEEQDMAATEKALREGAKLFKAFDAEEAAPSTGYSFDPAFPPEHFVSQYVAFSEMHNDAAREYAEAAGLALLALAAPQARVKLGPYGENGLPLNLYLLLVGDSSTSRKSTSQKLMASVAKWVRPDGLPGRIASPEALVEMLAKLSPQGTRWNPDEFGMFLAQMYAQDFKKGIEEVLLTVYDGETYTYVRAGEKETRVDDPSLTILGASTPEALGMAGPSAQVTGLLPRFGVVFPKVFPDVQPTHAVPAGAAAARNKLVKHLRRVEDFTIEHGAIQFEQDALLALNAGELALQALGDYAVRLPAMLHKVAALSAVGDLRSKVQLADAEAAIKVVNRWAEGAAHLKPFMRFSRQDLMFEKSCEEALQVFRRIRRRGSAPRYLIAREVKTTKAKLDAIEATLADRGYIIVNRGAGLWRRPR